MPPMSGSRASIGPGSNGRASKIGSIKSLDKEENVKSSKEKMNVVFGAVEEKTLVFLKVKKGEGEITEDDCIAMHRACGYGGPHVIPDKKRAVDLCKKWGKQAVECRTKAAGMDTPLMTAIKYGHNEIALELVHAWWDTRDETVIDRASTLWKQLRNKEIIEEEREDNRANVTARGIYRWTPLHYAAREAQTELVQSMIDQIKQENPTALRRFVNGMSINDKENGMLLDKNGRTPVWLTIFNAVVDGECRAQCEWLRRAKEVIQMLVENGADLHLALQCRYDEVHYNGVTVSPFKDKLFMEYVTDNEEELMQGRDPKLPARYFFNFLYEVAAVNKQEKALELLDTLQDEYDGKPKNKKNGKERKKG